MPTPLARRLWWFLPALELALASLLAIAWGDAWPAWLALGVLAAFTVALAANLIAGRRPPCPCFGASDRPISGVTVARNGVLMALALLATG